MGRTRNKSSPAGQPKLAREIKGLTCLVPQHPFGQESLSPAIRTRVFAQAFCKRLFDQDLVYVTPVDGLESLVLEACLKLIKLQCKSNFNRN